MSRHYPHLQSVNKPPHLINFPIRTLSVPKVTNIGKMLCLAEVLGNFTGDSLGDSEGTWRAQNVLENVQIWAPRAPKPGKTQSLVNLGFYIYYPLTSVPVSRRDV